MALDRSKVIETAQKYLAKSQYDRAIKEYQKLVKHDPKDVRTWLKIGDIFTKKGSRNEACETYGRVAKQYADQGFFLKAVAVYKQILKLDPGRLDTSLNLAEMYEQLQLVSDALNTYEQVAASYMRNGDVNKGLSTLDKMAKLDPENIPIRIKYAEALSKAGKTDEAASEFAAGADLLKDQGRMDDYLKVAERLLFHKPDDVGIARELAQLYVERKDAKRALTKLQLCFKTDPRDIGTLELLASAFEMLGQTPKTVSVYREVARIHQDAGRSQERAVALKRILELDPTDADARQALAAFAPPTGQPSARPAPEPPPSAVVQPSDSGVAAAEEAVPELETLEDAEHAELIEADEAQLIEADEAQLIEADEAEFIEADDEMIVDESDIIEEDEDDIVIMDEPHSVRAPEFEPAETQPEPVAFGAHQEFQEQHRPVLEVVPEPVEAKPVLEVVPEPVEAEPVLEVVPEEDVLDVLSDSIPPDVAREAQIARLMTECEVFQRYGLKSKVKDHLNSVLDLEPGHIEAREKLKDVYLADGQTEDAIAQLYLLAELFETEQPTVSQLYLRQILELDPLQERAHSILGSSAPGGYEDRPSEVMFVDEEPLAGQVAELDPENIPPAAKIPSEALAMAEEAASGEIDAEDDGLEPMSPAEFDAVPVRPSSPGELAAEAAVRLSQSPGEVEEILDEVDFFLAQGLFGEASNTLRDSLESFPEHPLILDKLAEVVEMEAVAAASLPPLEPASQDDSFLLAEKLAEELSPETDVGSDTLDVEEVFAQFKKGVSEQIDSEDSDTHYDLGIAYKEMGLLDDAINEFSLAMTNPERECIAFMMIGMCHVEKGAIADAIAALKKGLYAEMRTDREELGLYFELGLAYELLHDPQEAIYYYEKVQKRDATFRGVEAKLTSLRSANKGSSDAAPQPEQDEVDQAFDDLMGDD